MGGELLGEAQRTPELDHDLGVGQRLSHRDRLLTQRDLGERAVEPLRLGALQIRRGGQHQIGEARRLAQVRIDHAEVADLLKRRSGDRRLRLGDDGVGALDDAHLDLALVHHAEHVGRGKEPLPAEQQRIARLVGIVGRHMEQAARARRLEIGQHVVDKREVGRARRGQLVAALLVDVSRDGAQDAQRARGLHNVHAALEPVPGGDRRARRGGVLARERGDDVRRNAADRSRPLRRVGLPQLVGARKMGGQARKPRIVGPAVDELGIPQPLVDDDVEHRQHEREVGARLHLNDLVGHGGKVEAQRIDDHQLCPAVARVEDLGEHRRGRERRLLAPVDDEVGVDDVAERRHAAVGHALGDGARHEALRRAHAHLGAHAMRQALGHVVGEAPAACLAADERHRPRTARIDRRTHAAGELGDGLIPADALETARMALARTAQGVQHAPRIVRDLRAGKALRAQHAVGLERARNAVGPQHPSLGDVDVHLAGAVAPGAHARHRDGSVGVDGCGAGGRRRVGAAIRPAIGKLEDGFGLIHGNRPSPLRGRPRPDGRSAALPSGRRIP